MLRVTGRIALILCVALSPLICSSGIMPCCLAMNTNEALAGSQPTQSCCHQASKDSWRGELDSTAQPLSIPVDCCYCGQSPVVRALPVVREFELPGPCLQPAMVTHGDNDSACWEAPATQPASGLFTIGRFLRIAIASWIC